MEDPNISSFLPEFLSTCSRKFLTPKSKEENNNNNLKHGRKRRSSQEITEIVKTKTDQRFIELPSQIRKKSYSKSFLYHRKTGFKNIFPVEILRLYLQICFCFLVHIRAFWALTLTSSLLATLWNAKAGRQELGVTGTCLIRFWK